MPNLFDIPFASKREDAADTSSNGDSCSSPCALNIPMVAPTVGPRQKRLLTQFQTAAGNLLDGVRDHAVDPLGGLRSAMDHICHGTARPSIRLSKFDEFETQRNVAQACKDVAVEIVQAIGLISRCAEDQSEAEAFERASVPSSIVPAPTRTAESCVGYLVDVSNLADALQKLEALSEKGPPDGVQAVIPRAMCKIVTFCMLSFSPHLSPENMGRKLAVRYHPASLAEFGSAARWEIVASTPAA